MASRSVNKVILLGRLGKDAEMKFTANGTAVTSFSIATNRRWKSGNDFKEATDWHNIVFWKSEKLAGYLTKGKEVFVEGRLQTRSYESNGGKKYVTEVIAEEVILLDTWPGVSPLAAATSAAETDEEGAPF